MKDRIAAPRADKRPARTVHHGFARRDDYAWLKADNWREVMRDPALLPADIRAHLEAENAYADAVMAPTADLQKTLVAEMRGRIAEADDSVPRPDGAYAYASRYLEGADHPVFFRTKRDGGGEELLVDGQALSEGTDYFRLGAVEHSPDHRLVAYSTDTNGSEYYDIFVSDIGSGELLRDRIGSTAGDVVWAGDAKSFYYVRLDDEHRPKHIFRHRIGDDPATDSLVYTEPDPGYFVDIDQTLSRRFIVITARDHQTSEVRLIDTEAADQIPALIAPRKAGLEYYVDHCGELLYLRTNRNGAEDFEIATAPLATIGPDHWRTLVAHVPGRSILSMALTRHHLVRLEREDGLPRLVVRRLADAAEHVIAFDEEAYALALNRGLEFDTGTMRFTYSSLTRPAETYDYDMESRERHLRKRREVPSGHDPARYVARRLAAPAADGETVPVSVLMRRDTPLDGSAPLLIDGYGSYGITIPAGFDANVLSLVDRGFVFAIAHVRGSRAKGERWYRDGRRQKKTNTFSDFIAAAEHLVKEGFTSTGRIVAIGRSAGGMLMGAIANRAPQLFAGIIAEVPFVDVLATMLDASLPLTPPEWPEWGNPIESREDYETIAAYSPYDNIAALAYPAVLATGGLTDPRVTYWEPAKWAAKLRECTISDRPVLCRINMAAGHGGKSGRFHRLDEIALSFAFAVQAVDRPLSASS